MDKSQRNALRKCRVRLVNDLVIDDLLDCVETHGIFTSIMLEYIKAKESRPERVRVFLDYLQRRGPEAFEKFLLCLRESGQGVIASFIISEYENEIGQGVPKIKVENGTIQNQGNIAPKSPPNIYHTQETFGGQDMQGQSSRTFQNGQGQPGTAMEVEAGDNDMEMNQGTAGVQESIQPEPTSGVEETEGNTRNSGAGEQEQSSNSSRPELDAGTRWSQTGIPRTLSSASMSSSAGYTGNLTEEYKMETDPRGLVLIINNRDFDCDLGNRDGTDTDCESLRRLFLNLGFGVDIRHNLTARDMMGNMYILSRLEQLNDVDCLAVAILTHGSEDRLFGVDAQYVMVKDLIDPFTSQFCPALHNKPKFFIINACRGDAEDKGTPSMKLIYSDLEHAEKFCSDVSSLKPTASSAIKIPNMQDFLLAYSTIPGYVSWRHMNDGSWFIQELVKVFEQQADRKHVVDMLVTVNRRVAEIVNSKGVQIPAPTVMLTKNWYLNPL